MLEAPLSSGHGRLYLLLKGHAYTHNSCIITGSSRPFHMHNAGRKQAQGPPSLCYRGNSQLLPVGWCPCGPSRLSPLVSILPQIFDPLVCLLKVALLVPGRALALVAGVIAQRVRGGAAHAWGGGSSSVSCPFCRQFLGFWLRDKNVVSPIREISCTPENIRFRFEKIPERQTPNLRQNGHHHTSKCTTQPMRASMGLGSPHLRHFWLLEKGGSKDHFAI